MLRVRNIFSLVSKVKQIGYFCSTQPPNPPQQPPKPPQPNLSPQKQHNQHAPKILANQSQKQSQQPTQKGQLNQQQRQQQKSKSPDKIQPTTETQPKNQINQAQTETQPKSQINQSQADQQYKSQRWQSSRPPKWQPNQGSKAPDQPPQVTPQTKNNQQKDDQDKKMAPKKTLFGHKPEEKPRKHYDRDEDFDRHDRFEKKEQEAFDIKKEKSPSKFEPKKTAILFQATEEPKTKKYNQRNAAFKKYNVITKRANSQTKNDSQILSLVQRAEQTEDPIKRQEALIEAYAIQKDFIMMDETFENQKKFNYGVFSTYIVFLVRMGRMKKARQVIQKYDSKIPQLSPNVFKLIFQDIFSLRKYPVEIAAELEFLFLLTQKLNVDYNITTFEQLFVNTETDPYIVKVFNLYLSNFVKNSKAQQHAIRLPTLKNVFASAVKELLLENGNEAELLINNLKQLQQPVESHFSIQDLARYATYLTTKEDGFQKIYSLIKQIKNPTFIFSMEFGLKRLDSVGKQVICIDQENLEKLYLENKEHLSLPHAELFCLFADRFQHHSMVADIFQNQNQNKQRQYSSFIYQKAINVLIDASEGQSISNSVMSLVQEAKSKKVELSQITLQMSQIKAQIKEGKFELAYKLFTQNVIQDIILEFQKKKLMRFYIKYIQNVYIGKKFHRNYPQKIYKAKIRSAIRFINQLSKKALLSMYNSDKSDNLLLEGICGQKNIFEYSKGVVRRDIFKRVQGEILNNAYDYTKILNPKTEEEKTEREIIDNYRYFVQKEKLFRIAERRRKVIARILRQVNMRKLKWRTKAGILREVYQNFSRQKLEQGLLRSELIEFPELELVQQIQLKIKRESPQYTQFEEPTDEQEEVKIQQQEEGKSQPPKVTHEGVLKEKSVTQLKLEAHIRKQTKAQLYRLDKLKRRRERVVGLLNKLRKHKKKLAGKGKYRFQKYTMAKLAAISYYKAKQLEKTLRRSRQAQRRFIQMHYKITQHEDNLIPAQNLIRLRRPVIKRLSKYQSKLLKTKKILGEPLEEYGYYEFHFLDAPPTLSSFQQMKYIYYNLYSQYDHQIKTPPSNYQSEIWDLIAWGIQTKEPMAVKLGEYYSNLTGQKIPEHIVKMIADFYKYGVGETGSNLRNKWLRCLEIINNISTQKVYSHVTDPAFVTTEDIEYLMHAEVQQMYKGTARASLAITHSNNKFVRYGVSQRELLL